MGGREFADLEDVRAVARWLKEKADLHVHRTTGKPPLELFEQEDLQPLPAHPYDTAEVALRVCDAEGFVSFETNRWTYGREDDSSKTIKRRAIIDNQCLKPQNMFASRRQERGSGMTNHEMIADAVKNYRGETLEKKEIEEIVLVAFPQFSKGSLLPNDHAEGNKSSCKCAGTESRIFDRIEKNQYRVR